MSTENTGAAPDTTSSSQISPETASEVTETEGTEEVAEGSAQTAAQDAAAVIADPNATKAEKAEAKRTLKSLKIKVDGKEYNEELPFEIEDNPKAIEYMTKQLQLAKVSNKRMQEKGEIENEVRQFLQNLKENPFEVLSDPRIGLDVKKAVTEYLEAQIAHEKKSPAEQKAEALEKENRRLKEEREREKAQYLEEQRLKAEEAAYTRYEMQINDAFAKNPDVAKTPANIERISNYVALGIKNGLDVSPEEVMHLVRQEADEEFRQKLIAASDEDLEKLIGKERLTKLQKQKLAKAKAAQAAAIAAPKIPDTGIKGEKKEEKAKPKTMREFFGV